MIGSSESSLACLSEGIALNTSLVYLNLSNNQISHCGASFISSALTTNETLFELGIIELLVCVLILIHYVHVHVDSDH